MVAATDDFVSYNPGGLGSPPAQGAAVTKSDTLDLTNVSRFLWIAGAGDITVTLEGMATGTSVLLSAVPAGTLLPLRVSRVWATGTTATGIVALW